MATNRKPKSAEPAIKAIAERLKGLADEAVSRACLLRTKADFAQLIYDNGASLLSVSEKLGWPESKLANFLESDKDIDIRTLTDVAFALGKRLSVDGKKIPKTFEPIP